MIHDGLLEHRQEVLPRNVVRKVYGELLVRHDEGNRARVLQRIQPHSLQGEAVFAFERLCSVSVGLCLLPICTITEKAENGTHKH